MYSLASETQAAIVPIIENGFYKYEQDLG